MSALSGRVMYGSFCLISSTAASMHFVKYSSKLPRFFVMTRCASGAIDALTSSKDLFAQRDQLLAACLAALDRLAQRLCRGLLHCANRQRGEVRNVLQGVVQHLSGGCVLDLRGLRLQLDVPSRM